MAFVGNARIVGLAEDLQLSGMRYQMAAAAFFITYSLFEIPCNVLLQLVRPSIWSEFLFSLECELMAIVVPSLTLAWGIVSQSIFSPSLDGSYTSDSSKWYRWCSSKISRVS
ncbi:hypothetical protein K438DRAFT_1825644 [Mycena galopus ATCC 62051]|nr:hypothetical protein K438DRAFT_1825644 [Mycena galopus ATCC 62051]